jgi:opacity protein-like surface antigen
MVGGNVHRLVTRLLAVAGLSCVLMVPGVQAQGLVEVEHHNRFEFTPFGAYQWGGSLETDQNILPAGELQIEDSFGWGGILSFLLEEAGAVELTYLRQDTDIHHRAALSGDKTDLGGFAVNYIQIGGIGMPVHNTGQFKPFLSGSLGVGIFDPKTEGIGSDTRFSWSVGAGGKYMAKSNRVGVRFDARLWVTPFPSGDYGTWCDFYGCFVVEGTEWVTQGTLSTGLVLAF